MGGEREADLEDGWGDDAWGDLNAPDLAANLRLSVDKVEKIPDQLVCCFRS